MPFLDLICCAFAGIVILFVLADRSQGATPPVQPSATIVRVQVDGSGTDIVGLQLRSSATNITPLATCWPPYACLPGGTTIALARAGEANVGIRGLDPAAPFVIDIALLQLAAGRVLGASICVRVTRPGSAFERKVKLARAQGYRATLPANGAMPTGTLSC